ncbi:NAD(P)/FAD-dependent oxidoreductase [Nitritalea halalkaliphila]|uniref:NAD(P)/FAD-dependent oxidoreductase n=1 Tax=Nitritalea halalkaliphila TaxID=590849 RepID=UPI0002F79933|nr:FAD-dependent oxidoreductase [Nitritalea halalkaliphila]
MISNFEEAYNTNDRAQRETLMNVVVVGGGPTGVELAGAIAEMKKYALPYDYPTMDWTQMEVYLVEMSPRLLNGMSDASGEKSLEFLKRLGVKVRLNCAVGDYDGEVVKLADDETIRTQTLIWAAGIRANPVPGLPEAVFGSGGRIQTNGYHQVEGLDGVYVLGDLALTPDENFKEGHPQVAQVAIQQASNCAYNFKSLLKNRPFKSFLYKDLGTMATIGRKKAVVDLPFFSFQGFFAWLAWLFVHLMAIVGVKNRLFIFLNWAWSYLSFDASLRLLIRPVLPKFEAEEVQERMVEDPKAKVDEKV